MYARGLSMRDIEAAFTDEAGRCVLSASAASEVCERLWDRVPGLRQRDLSELAIVYLFVDGVAERLHLGAAARGGAGRLGHRRAGPSTCWRCCRGEGGHGELQRLPSRPEGPGMRDPLLVVTDGAPGLIRGRGGVPARAFASAAWRTRCATSRQGARRALARVRSDGAGGVSGQLAGAGTAGARRVPQDLGPRAAQRDSVLRRRLRGLHRAPAPADRRTDARSERPIFWSACSARSAGARR